MYTDEMEKYFANYLESREYDEAEGLLLSMLRKAYLAGWNDATLEAARSAPKAEE